MDANFWHQRWQSNQIGFHQSNVNPYLMTHFKELGIAEGSRVFVPLCGKTLDIAWLLSQGYQVAGAELSEIAIQQLFSELGVTPDITAIGKMQHYRAINIDIFVGDIFDITAEMLGSIDAIYDRAALIALPEQIRVRYTHHITALTDTAPQLLLTYEYDQSLRNGPPFSVRSEEVHRHYSEMYDIGLLVTREVVGELRGVDKSTEKVWLLKPLGAKS